ncbi:hypothetical protein [Aphanothece hegewaldii]|nr:hypothetical protein [Aphanothece hegewaldii]
MTKLLERVQITLKNVVNDKSLSYLSQIRSFSEKFERSIQHNLASLLNL